MRCSQAGAHALLTSMPRYLTRPAKPDITPSTACRREQERTQVLSAAPPLAMERRTAQSRPARSSRCRTSSDSSRFTAPCCIPGEHQPTASEGCWWVVRYHYQSVNRYFVQLAACHNSRPGTQGLPPDAALHCCCMSNCLQSDRGVPFSLQNVLKPSRLLDLFTLLYTLH